jgi:hypothetical protein
MITLSKLLKNNTAWSSIQIRKYETPEERRQGFLNREQRRNAQSKEEKPVQEIIVQKQKEVDPEVSCEVSNTAATAYLEWLRLMEGKMTHAERYDYRLTTTAAHRRGNACFWEFPPDKKPDYNTWMLQFP